MRDRIAPAAIIMPMKRKANFFASSPIALFADICYKRAVPAAVITPMKRKANFFASSPIALFSIICYNSTVKSDRTEANHMHPIEHFRTITRHRHMVLRHCIKAGIPLQGLLHDLSKFTPTEFIPGMLYWQGTRSPNEKERELFGYSEAWMHHKGRNKHHFEYW